MTMLLLLATTSGLAGTLLDAGAISGPYKRVLGVHDNGFVYGVDGPYSDAWLWTREARVELGVGAVMGISDAGVVAIYNAFESSTLYDISTGVLTHIEEDPEIGNSIYGIQPDGTVWGIRTFGSAVHAYWYDGTFHKVPKYYPNVTPYPEDMNDSHEFVLTEVGDYSLAVRSWSGGTSLIQLPQWVSGSEVQLSAAIEINEAGHAIGLSKGNPGRTRGWFLRNGTQPTDVGHLGKANKVAPKDLNESDEVVGNAETAAGHQHAFYWFDGTITDLGTLGGDTSRAVAILEDGTIYGTSATSEGHDHAYRYDGTTMHDLGTLGGDTSTLVAVNQAGWAIGNSDTAEGESHAFLYDGTTMHDLGTLGGTMSKAVAINELGMVAGETRDADGATHAFLYLHSEPPVADAGDDQHGHPGVPSVLDATGSTDEDSVSVAWTLTAPDASDATGDLDDPTDPAASFSPTQLGTYTAHLVVTDPWGLTDEDEVTIEVNNLDPVASLSPATSSTAYGQEVTLDASGSTDADGDDLAFTWTITAGPDGATLTGNAATAVFSASTTGTYEVTVEVADGIGTPASATASVEVRSQPPVAVLDAPTEAAPGDDVVLDARASTDDVGIVSYAWSAADADGDQTSRIDDPTAPVAILAIEAGAFDVTLVVTDADGQTATATTTITAVRDIDEEDRDPDEKSCDSTAGAPSGWLFLVGLLGLARRRGQGRYESSAEAV